MAEQEYPDVYKKVYEKAKRQGKMYCYLTCVREGYMPLVYALQESGLTESEFMRAMTKTTSIVSSFIQAPLPGLSCPTH